MTRDETQAIEKQIDDLCAQLGEVSMPQFTPKFPWVLVRVLKREQRLGAIITPEAQNKPIIEGVVLKTWGRANQNWTGKCFYDVNSEEWQYPELMESRLTPGQHVVFPHWAGMPAYGWETARYRLVKECNWRVDKEGGIFASIDREGSLSARAILTQTVCNTIGALAHYLPATEMVDALLEKYIVIDREESSVLLSGV